MRLEGVQLTVGGRAVLRDLDLALFPGEHWLLSGPNGGGKSSLLKLLGGELWPASGQRTYHLDGQPRRSAVRARLAFALVSPEVETFYLTRDWAQSVRDLLLAAFEGDRLRLWTPTPAALARLDEVADLVGLGELLERDFRTLSHGQRRRAVLGRALMPRPQALLLDEFTEGLSASALAELRAVLERVAAGGVSLVLATHTPGEAPALPWRRLRVEGGTVLEGPPPPLRPRRSAPPQAPPMTGRPLVEVRDASVYRNGQPVLQGVSWTWQVGQHWLVSGPNGAGKSSFARLVAGLSHPALGGTVARPFLEGPDTLAARQRHTGMQSAESAALQRRDWTGRAVIASGYAGSVGFAAELEAVQAAQVEALAERLAATDLLERPASTLSQGQLKRLLLARALVHRPRLLILDEPFDFLDDPAREAVWSLLEEAVRGGTHLLLVAHRQADVPDLITHELRLDGGRVVGAGALARQGV